MSSFILNNYTINALLRGFTYIEKRETFKNYAWDNGFINAGQKLVNLNNEAVNYRYNDKEKPFKFVEIETIDLNDFQFLKTLSCFLYQCSEGNIPKKALFKKLRELEESRTAKIVSEINEYKNAKWGDLDEK